MTTNINEGILGDGSVMKSDSSRPTLVIAASDDAALGPKQAALDAHLTYEQVDAVVRRALDLDASSRALKHTVSPTDWVVIKPNIVTNRGRRSSSYWFNDVPHPGQVTDLRVIKSLIGYLVENCRPRRITVAEGGAEWRKTGTSNADPRQTEDGWTVHWPEFGGLSYADIVKACDAAYPDGSVDIVDLNCDEIRFVPVPDPFQSGLGAMQRVGATARPADCYGREAYVPGTGELRQGYYIPQTILTCDKVISVPAMKTHICGTSLAMKNYIGILPSHPSGLVGKGEIHKGDTQKGFIDLFSYHPAEYSLIEGFWSTEGNGPQWGDNVRHNVIIASSDPVAADAVGSSVMGFNPLDLDYLYYAASKGFGTFDLKRMQIVGRSVESVRRTYERASGRKSIGFAARGNRRWLVRDAQESTWRVLQSEERYIDLSKAFAATSIKRARAQTTVLSARSQRGQLWASAEGRMTVYLNNRPVVKKEAATGHRFAEYRTDVTLQAGANLLEVEAEGHADGFGFTALLCTDQGDRMDDITYVMDGNAVSPSS